MNEFFERWRRRLRWRTHLFGTWFLDRQNYTVIRRSRFNEILDRLLEKPKVFFIQVGANDGVRFDSLYQRVTRIFPHGLVIEPLPRYFARLKMNYEDYPGVIAVNAALHPSAAHVDIHHPDPAKIEAAGLPAWAGGIGSVIPGHCQRSNVPNDCMLTTRVPAVSFTTLLEKYRVDHVDLLQIDAEGFDLELLRMFPFDRIQPGLVKYEHDWLDRTARLDAERLLRAHDYTVLIEGGDTFGIHGPSLPWALPLIH